VINKPKKITPAPEAEAPQEPNGKKTSRSGGGVARWLHFLDIGRWLNYRLVMRNLPFLLFLAGLGILYIANSHYAIKSIRSIDQLDNTLKESQWQYKIIKDSLEFRSQQTQVAGKVQALGLQPLSAPPIKINQEHPHGH